MVGDTAVARPVVRAAVAVDFRNARREATTDV
jgi:hypothetical protein